MKELVPKDEFGVFADAHDVPRVDSRFVAEFFEKEHRNVLRDIRSITEPKSGLSAEFTELNFEPTSYIDNFNRKQRCYAMTRDGFTMLVMGYSGAKAMRFKELYIKRFNDMEHCIAAMVTARQQFPLLTENIKLLHDNPRPYHFSNECDMLNRLVLGVTAKQYREAHGIPKGESIRPYLSQAEIEQLEMLQRVDIGLLVAVPDFQQRKRHLEWYIAKKLAA